MEFQKTKCNCHESYSSRKLTDPNCCACNCDYNAAVDEIESLKANAVPDGYIAVPSSAWDELVQADAERDTLRAQVEKLTAALSLAEQMFIDYEMDVDCPAPLDHRLKMAMMRDAMAKRDAEVRAQAVDRYAEMLRNEARLFELQAECRSKGSSWYNWQTYYASNAAKFANQIRQQAKGE